MKRRILIITLALSPAFSYYLYLTAENALGWHEPEKVIDKKNYTFLENLEAYKENVIGLNPGDFILPADEKLEYERQQLWQLALDNES